MATEFETVDIWLGKFNSEADLVAYLSETYSGDDEDRPISQFAADQSQWFYDHDFLESAYVEGAADLSNLLGQCSFANSFVPDVIAKAREISPSGINAAVLVFGNEIEEPKSVEAESHVIKYIGKFRCDPKA